MATAYSATRMGWAVLGPIGLVMLGLMMLSAGCGSSAYDDQLETTATKSKTGQSAPAAKEADKDAGQGQATSQPAAQPTREPRQQGNGAGGTGIGNAIGLAPM